MYTSSTLIICIEYDNNFIKFIQICMNVFVLDIIMHECYLKIGIMHECYLKIVIKHVWYLWNCNYAQMLP